VRKVTTFFNQASPTAGLRLCGSSTRLGVTELKLGRFPERASS
jgi:hypothetical protein